MVDNTDDHVKNHGMLHVSQGQYKLAPAFDVVMQLKNLGYQQLAITLGNHKSSLGLALNAAPHFGLNSYEAKDLIHTIHETAINELINIADHFGAIQALKTHIQQCLSRQQEVINA